MSDSRFPITYRMLGRVAANPDAPVKCNCVFDEGHEPTCDIVAAHNFHEKHGNPEFTNQPASPEGSHG